MTLHKRKMQRFSVFLAIIACRVTLQFVAALTVDNQLVSARNDCFERVALEAMMPFDKTFRTEDTNSLKNCKEKCLQAGERCQSMAFGVHRRGNGTCQLSSEKYSTTSGRPKGIIFDPDFDLYTRKTNCFDLSDNTIPLADGGPSTDGVQDGYGSSLPPSIPPTVHLPNRPNENDPNLIVNPTPTTTTITTTTTNNGRPIYSTNGYGTDSTTTQLLPISPGHDTTTFDPHPTDGDRLYFSHDIYPLYKYPALYEHNYPAPNDDFYIPGGYASNVPSIDADRYRPNYHVHDDHLRPTPSGPPRPIFGLGYGNGYSYGKPERFNQTTIRPYDQGDADHDRPIYAPRPGSYNHNDPHPMGPPQNRPNYDTTPSTHYTPPPPPPPPSNRPNDYGPNRLPTRQPPPPPPPQPQRPGDFIDYTNRPDPPQDGYGSTSSHRPPMRDHGGSSRPTSGYGDQGGQSRPTSAYGDRDQPNRYDYVRRNGSSSGRPGDYNDDKTISTYFNPEDYMKPRPGSYGEHDRIGHPMDEMTACFRRVLAGKRVAPQWVRRTIACERVEECMRECGHEKRFMCEGFNYRIDPSGHGQGDCELIDIPLAQMDLYSSPSRRDSNLLRHPDYDYYERDRNAPSSCRKSLCQDCRLTSPPLYFKPSGGSGSWESSGGGSSGSYAGGSHKPYPDEHYPPSSSGYDSGSHSDEHYRFPSAPPHISYDRRPPPSHHIEDRYHSSSASYEYSSHGSDYYDHRPPSSYGSTGSGAIDRYDSIRPDDHHHRYGPSRPDRWETIPSGPGYESSSKYRPRPEPDRFRPPYLPGPNYTPYRPHDIPSHPSSSGGSSYESRPPPALPPPSPHSNYLDRDGPPSSYKKPSKFVPYLIGSEENWGSYGGSYGGSYNKQSSYWGLSDHNRRKDPFDFNYFELGGSKHREPPAREPNSVLSYPGSKYGPDDYRDRHDYRHQWTRRPGPDECSAKTSEGFRLHKTAVRHSFSVPTLTECERLCSGQDGFICQTFSYRYTPAGRDNCMLCDRPVNLLDYYIDIEPDRDYDIYSMTDELDVCRKPSRSDGPPPPHHGGGSSSTALSDPRNMQCFFRALDSTRFFKSIVRDSLTVRSVGECEMECIKSSKFTCRAFAFRYGQQRHASVIDNCQLSDWPVRDMDKDRHLILDATFDVFERASYGHGCELQPIMDQKHKKFCYLGYGSPAKLLPKAIKKVISAPTEAECKKECIRFRETTSFKCYSFSYCSRSRSYNCEMSDLDQTELKLDVHYTHTSDRDYWLFAWNPFDWTCRDKVNTIGGGNRVNNDRRMDIFREPGDLTWRHYTVSGKACRRSSPCAKNLVTGFYSCEIDGGEVGSWDYCCKTDHPCGYSRGFDYPWCFVGDEPDQWRKCSDRYYPGNRTQTHSGLTASTNKSEKKKYAPEKGHHSDDFQHPPRPGGLQSISDFAAARLWPVTYLYSEGPPNSTEFSNFVDCNKESC